jgi:hypothetical protein
MPGCLGNLFRNGKVYTTKTVEVFDHDFPLSISVEKYPPNSAE